MFHDTVGNQPVGYQRVFTGRKQVTGAGVATPISTSELKVKGVYVSVDIATNASITIGDSNVAAGNGFWRGCILFIGNPPLLIPTDDLNKVYFCSDNPNAILCYTYFI